MFSYVLRRLAATIPVMVIVAVLVFLMLRLTPSDPAAIIAGDNANAEQVAEIRKRLGLDQPILTQFVIWSSKTLQGDLGESFFFKKQVAELILDRLEPTLSLAFFTILLAVLIAIPLGVLAAYRHGSWLDRIVMGFSVLGFSVPVFVIGYVLIYVFAIELNWLPVQGYQRLAQGFGGWLQRLILPSVTLSVIYVALIARITRADRDRDRARCRPADRRRRGHRIRLHHPRPRPTYRGRGAGPRLSDHPGRHPAVLAHLRAHQPPG
jgi:peptide/nickel transport system permease protein